MWTHATVVQNIYTSRIHYNLLPTGSPSPNLFISIESCGPHAFGSVAVVISQTMRPKP